MASRKKLLGIDIGNYSVKIAVNQGNGPEELIQARIPDGLMKEGRITSGDAMGDFLKEVLREHGVRIRSVFLGVPNSLCFVRRVHLPLMTVGQLRVNLPYEFHDYISQDMDRYIYDYAVIGKTENSMDLIAVAAEKRLAEESTLMMRRAGLKLVGLAPDMAGFSRVLSVFEQVNGMEPHQADYAVLDLGDRSIKIHFFSRGVYDVTRNIEPGLRRLVDAAAEQMGLDRHIARIRMESGAPEVLHSEATQSQYTDIAVEIMRVLNFYSFSNRDNNLTRLYYCGGGALNRPLVEEIRNTVELELVPFASLLTGDPEIQESIQIAPQSYGFTMDPEGGAR